MTDKFKSNNTDDFPIFLPIGKAKIEQMLAKTIRLTNNVSAVLKINNDEIIFSEDILIDIFDRIEKRRVYFHVFKGDYDQLVLLLIGGGAALLFIGGGVILLTISGGEK